MKQTQSKFTVFFLLLMQKSSVYQEPLLTCQLSSPESKLSADPNNGGVYAAASTAAATVKVSL